MMTAADPSVATARASAPSATLSRLRESVSGVLTYVALVAGDLLALTGALAVAVVARVSVLPLISGSFHRPTYPLSHYFQVWWLALVYLGALWYAGLYTRRDPYWQEVRRCLSGATLGAILIFAALSLARIGDDVSRPVVVIAWLAVLLILPLSRLIVKRALIRTGHWRRRVLLVGETRRAEWLKRALERERTLGYEVAGFVSDPAAASALAQAIGAKDVILSDPELGRSEFLGLVERLRDVAENVIIAPDLAAAPVLGVEVVGLFEHQTIMLRVPNNLLKPWNLAVKRLFDVIVGAAAAIIALPFLAIAALAIKATSPGPVFHVEARVGRKQRLFSCYKLRTMHTDGEERLAAHVAGNPEAASEWERYRKLRAADPRVTSVGRWLRRYSLDEAPQLLNVLRGDMSLVGARPYLPREMPLVAGRGMLDLRPGMTGLWQVSGRNALDFHQRAKLDRYYVGNWSLWLDVMILAKTIPALLQGEFGNGIDGS